MIQDITQAFHQFLTIQRQILFAKMVFQKQTHCHLMDSLIIFHKFF